MTTQNDFATFWTAFPRRLTTPRITGKRKAMEKCKALVRASVVTWDELIAGAEVYAKCDNVSAGYVKMPITWLNNYCWEDEYDGPPQEDSAEWWRARCEEASNNRFMRDRFDHTHRNYCPAEIRAEYPDLYPVLRAVE